MTDIVERLLRSLEDDPGDGHTTIHVGTVCEAAAAITRLRGEVERLKDEQWNRELNEEGDDG